ncbi:MAG: nuclease superfamily [Planctomycetota bacterium]
MSLRGRADAVSGRMDSMRTALLGPCAAPGTEFLIEFSTVIVDCAVRLHQELGPGPMESVYEFTLARRL